MRQFLPCRQNLRLDLRQGFPSVKPLAFQKFWVGNRHRVPSFPQASSYLYKHYLRVSATDFDKQNAIIMDFTCSRSSILTLYTMSTPHSSIISDPLHSHPLQHQYPNCTTPLTLHPITTITYSIVCLSFPHICHQIPRRRNHRRNPRPVRHRTRRIRDRHRRNRKEIRVRS